MPTDDRSDLTLILLTWRIWWASNNFSWWQMGCNLVFRGLKTESSSQNYSSEFYDYLRIMSCRASNRKGLLQNVWLLKTFLEDHNNPRTISGFFLYQMTFVTATSQTETKVKRSHYRPEALLLQPAYGYHTTIATLQQNTNTHRTRYNPWSNSTN